MSEVGIPAKLIRLYGMTLSNSCSSVKIGKDLSEPFATVRGFRQGDPLSRDLFSFLLERLVCIAMALFSTRVYSFLRTTLTSKDQESPG